MKRYILFLVAILFFSCQDDIEINLPQNDQKLIVEAKFTDKLESREVKLFRSSNVNDSQENNLPVTGAQVYVQLGSGEKVFFEEIYDGVYVQLQDISSLIQNETYELNILLKDGKRYKSTKEVYSYRPELENLIAVDDSLLLKVFPDIELQNIENPYSYSNSLKFYSFLIPKMKDIKEENYTWKIKWSDYTNNLKYTIREKTHVTNLLSGIPQECSFFIYEGLNYSTGLYSSGINLEGSMGILDNGYVEYLNQLELNLSSQSNPIGTPFSTFLSNIKNVENSQEVVIGYFSLQQEFDYVSVLNQNAFFSDTPEFREKMLKFVVK